MYTLLFSHQILSKSSWLHGWQYAELPCPSPPPWIFRSSCPLSQWCHPTISPTVASSPPALNLSQDQSLFQWVHSLQQVAKYWSFSFSNSSSNEYSGLIFFSIDWFDLAVQGALKSLLQYQSSKASILQCLAFFVVQLSHLYMILEKNRALTIWTFVSEVMFFFVLLIHCLVFS